MAVTANVQAAFLITKTSKPDYKKMQAYADKAIALKPNDPQANFAEGIALTGEWAQSHDDSQKKKALDALNQADSLAKAAGNEALALLDRNVYEEQSRRQSPHRESRQPMSERYQDFRPGWANGSPSRDRGRSRRTSIFTATLLKRNPEREGSEHRV